MEYCKNCNTDISEAKYLLLDNKVYKSCPGCSKNEGQHMFYDCPSAFGQTAKRITIYNPMGLQSHCGRCRAGRQGPYGDAIGCSDAEERGGVIISEIRFLPMSSSVFATYEDACDFLNFDMQERGNTYYYMKSKMTCEDNALVLFQYDGHLIGHAIFEKENIFEEPIIEDGQEYQGYYQFRKNSVRVLKTPISAQMFASIDVEFKGFNQSHQRKSVGLLPSLIELIKEGAGTIDDGKVDFTIPEELDEEETSSLKEGQKKQITVNAYERNPQAKKRCLAYYRRLNQGKIKCEICGFDFGEVYGKNFEGKIHVHHIKEISTIGEEYKIDATKDLIPICPNCHMVAHSRKPAYKPEEIKGFIDKSTIGHDDQ